MRHMVFAVVALLVTAAAASPQEAGTRAWQQRLELEMPVPVPIVELAVANPFAEVVDTPPELVSATPPRKLPVVGRARVAAYVDAKGNCLGAVPLSMPFSGLTSHLLKGFEDSRFEPASSGDRAVPTWAVVAIDLEGRVKEGTVVTQLMELPDPSRVPEPTEPTRMSPPGRLAELPAVANDTLTAAATPRRLKVKVPARDTEIALRALVHVSASGRCDRFVPLELEEGLYPWMSAFLGTWQLRPAQREGNAVDSWVVYTARVRMSLGSLQSTAVKVLRGDSYTP